MEERIYITKNTEHHQSRRRFLSILREYPLHDKGRSCPWATFFIEVRGRHPGFWSSGGLVYCSRAVHKVSILIFVRRVYGILGLTLCFSYELYEAS